jgi:hypothetical protein
MSSNLQVLAPEPVLLEVIAGSDYPFEMELSDSTGAAVNLTGYSAQLDLCTTLDDTVPDIELTVGSGVTITAASGIVSVSLTAAQTGAREGEERLWHLWLTDPSSNVQCIGRGTIRFVKGGPQ